MPVATMRTRTSSERGASSSSSRSSNGACFSSTTAAVIFIVATPSDLARCATNHMQTRKLLLRFVPPGGTVRRDAIAFVAQRMIIVAMRLATVHRHYATFAATLSRAGAHPVLDAAGERVRDV